MAQENIMFNKYDDGPYNIVDLYLYDIYIGYEDSYNYMILMLIKYWYIKK